MRFLVLLIVLAPLHAQQVRPPLEAMTSESSIGLVSLAMDGLGRKQLCAQSSAILDIAGRSIGDVRWESACSGPGLAHMAITSASFSERDKSMGLICELLETPVALFAPKLKPISFRAGERPKDWFQIEDTLDRLGVRKLGGLLDAAGFARLRAERDGGSVVLDEPVYRLVAACV